MAQVPERRQPQPRRTHDLSANRGLNRAAGAANGPCRTPPSTSSPATSASPAVTSTTGRHDASSNARTRCGLADPTVSAPTIRLNASPRLRRVQVAASFKPGGYTPARNAPVRKRRTAPSSGPVAITARPAVVRAAPAALRANSRDASKRSGMLRTPLTSVPATNPNCTASVSHAAAPAVSCHSAWISGATAAALNHGASASSSATVSRLRFRHLRTLVSAGGRAFLIGKPYPAKCPEPAMCRKRTRPPPKREPRSKGRSSASARRLPFSGGWHALVSESHKYIWESQSGQELLFDVVDDPNEMRDLAPDAGIAPWRRQLVEQLAD